MQVSNDVRMLLPLLVGVLAAKWVADAATHSLYHGLLEVCPYPSASIHWSACAATLFDVRWSRKLGLFMQVAPEGCLHYDFQTSGHKSMSGMPGSLNMRAVFPLPLYRALHGT